MSNSRAGRRRHGRDAPYSGRFAGRLIEMLESPAYRVLSQSAHRVLSRIEIELHHHASYDNGKLIVTYDNFRDYGMDGDAIAPAIRECEALGFLVVTERGCGGNAESRMPNKYRLTYRAADGIPGDGTHEWRRFEDMDEAKAIANAARNAKTERRYRYAKQPAPRESWRPARQKPVREMPTGAVTQKQKPSRGKPPVSVRETPIERNDPPIGETPTTAPVGKPRLLSISREGDTVSDQERQDTCTACGRALMRNGAATRFCSNACRQRAYRVRHRATPAG